jgi:protoporphyrinogen oxidase
MGRNRVIVVGAGPAGLTAAWELTRAGHDVMVLERDPEYVGGLARTIYYQGFRFDLGAHRFFSRNTDISRWWHERLPGEFVRIKRLTRILYRGRFFQYPLRAGEALFGLGPGTTAKCLLSYLKRQLFPIRPERSFEDWVSNRFGDHLYRIFFKTYTEKVWGMPCSDISADWASQRIKGLSLWKAALDAFGFEQKTARTLVDEFEYPRLGAGMLWERTRDEILSHGGRVLMGHSVTRLEHDHSRIAALHSISASGETQRWAADAFILSMPLRDCVLGMDPPMEPEDQAAANQLSYRDFIVVALIVNRTDLFPDNWIYVHDPAVKVGRIDNYNNWGKEMNSQPNTTCVELEYFCSHDDALWRTDDPDLIALAKRELEQLGLAKATEVLDGCVVRVEKAYPVYDANYRRNVDRIRRTLARFENLQVAGRNGMHKYNNQDHSMLTGILTARNVDGGRHDVWKVNTDAEYQEQESTESGRRPAQRITSSEKGG